MGKTARAFKTRYREHNLSLKIPPKQYRYRGEDRTRTDQEINDLIEERRNKSMLVKYVWKMRDKGRETVLKWSLSKRAHRYTIGCKFCDLCATEKTCIALGDPKYMLNKRTEIYRKCDYMKRYKLEALLTDPP